MGKASLAIIGILFAGMIVAPGAGAFEIGENRVENGDFEANEAGAMPQGWDLTVTG